MKLRGSVIVLISVLFLANPEITLKAQEVLLGNPPPVKQRVSIDQIDHSPWTALLQKYVDVEGKVDYQGWKNSPADSTALDAYINSLATASNTIAATKNGQLAFWINAYNAITVKGILREYPTSSIRKHTSKWGGYNIWKHLKLRFNDSNVSLETIEHQVLRKMNEPRIHFAIVCASHSCPRLWNQAYTAKELENQLTTNTLNFFANNENFEFSNPNRFKLSTIMKWYSADFGSTQAEQLRSIANYLPTKEAQAAALKPARVSYLNYDWNLNERKTRIVQTSKTDN